MSFVVEKNLCDHRVKNISVFHDDLETPHQNFICFERFDPHTPGCRSHAGACRPADTLPTVAALTFNDLAGGDATNGAGLRGEGRRSLQSSSSSRGDYKVRHGTTIEGSGVCARNITSRLFNLTRGISTIPTAIRGPRGLKCIEKSIHYFDPRTTVGEMLRQQAPCAISGLQRAHLF